MEHVENQLDWLEEKPKKARYTSDVYRAGNAHLRRIHTIHDLRDCDFARPAPFTVVRISPTSVMVLKDGYGL